MIRLANQLFTSSCGGIAFAENQRCSYCIVLMKFLITVYAHECQTYRTKYSYTTSRLMKEKRLRKFALCQSRFAHNDMTRMTLKLVYCRSKKKRK